jgi:hypothetical protein
MGQKRPVQIVNFVAKGTIEEGMLSVLAFKRSLSAGILDGGSGEISLGGSRLSRFMKDIENMSEGMRTNRLLWCASNAIRRGCTRSSGLQLPMFPTFAGESNIDGYRLRAGVIVQTRSPCEPQGIIPLSSSCANGAESPYPWKFA